MKRIFLNINLLKMGNKMTGTKFNKIYVIKTNINFKTRFNGNRKENDKIDVLQRVNLNSVR